MGIKQTIQNVVNVAAGMAIVFVTYAVVFNPDFSELYRTLRDIGMASAAAGLMVFFIWVERTGRRFI